MMGLNRVFNRIIITLAMLYLLALLLFASCATTKKERVGRAGIKGKVVPVDALGEEIKRQDKEKIVINCIPVREGIQLFDKSLTGNAKANGDFTIDLKFGEYVVEVFLEGFYVESFFVTLDQSRRKNFGEIRLKRIETGSGIPLTEDAIEDVIINEGDVNIQPPS